MSSINLHLIKFCIYTRKGCFLLDIVSRIRQLTKERGLKLSYITDKIGITRTYFSDVERGKTKISEERLTIIADCLDTTTDYLLGKTEQKNKPSADDDRELTKDEENFILAYRALTREQKEIYLRAVGLDPSELLED